MTVWKRWVWKFEVLLLISFVGKKSSENTHDEAEKGEMSSFTSSDSDDELLNEADNEKKVTKFQISTVNGSKDDQ